MILNKDVIDLWKSTFPEAVLAGGALRAMYDSTEIKDYDFFIDINRYMHMIPDLRKKLSTDIKCSIYAPNAKYMQCVYNNQVIEFIGFRGFRNPIDLIEQFDFNVCQIAMDVNGQRYAGYDFIRGARNKDLRLRSIVNGPKTIERLVRYVNKGYTISDNHYREIFTLIKESKHIDNSFDIY